MAQASELPSHETAYRLTFFHHGLAHSKEWSSEATITDLSDHIQAELAIPPSHQKFMISPKVGIVLPPFEDSRLLLKNLCDKKITLFAPTAAELSRISPKTVQALPSRSPRPTKLTPYRDSRKIQEEFRYTFTTILPLPYLPNSARSKAYLERLRDDPGIKAAMTKHKLAVSVLTEMDPAAHTTHESKTLGLNRNKGETIELRLRTDAYDGYRDYKIIRDTLCHELAHNIWSEHDRNFWDFCKLIERDVRQNDWKSGGQCLSHDAFYDSSASEARDSSATNHLWCGTERKLGGQAPQIRDLSQREISAQAAEKRIRDQCNEGREND